MSQLDDHRGEIRYVNELINHRLTWLGTLQGLLFAAVAFAWNEPRNEMLVYVIGFLGAFVALSIGLGTYGANLVIEDLERKVDQITRKPDPNPVWRNRLKWWWWLMPGYFIPWLFFAAWVAIAALRWSAGAAPALDVFL